MSEVSMVRRRRRLASPVLPDPAPAAPLDDDDLLLEILLRLPPQPSFLLRASVVCIRWRRLVSDPGFLRHFRSHHRKPPLLGFFSREGYAGGYFFTPTLDPPDRIPAGRFSQRQDPGEESLDFVGCRHGLALLLNRERPEAVVWNPISGHQCRVAFPPEIDLTAVIDAAVLCAAGDDDHGHVHGDCDLSYFNLALVLRGDDGTSALACLYKSKSAMWGNTHKCISLTTRDWLSSWTKGGVLVGNAFYWLIDSEESGILQFDFDMQNLAVIEKPVYRHTENCSFQIIRTQESTLGLIVLTQELIMQLWERKVDSDDAGRWVLHKTIELVDHLSPRHHSNERYPLIRGYDEDHNVLLLRTFVGLFMIQLDSMESKNIPEEHFITCRFPYTCFYASDWATGGRDNGPGMSSST